MYELRRGTIFGGGGSAVFQLRNGDISDIHRCRDLHKLPHGHIWDYFGVECAVKLRELRRRDVFCHGRFDLVR